MTPRRRMRPTAEAFAAARGDVTAARDVPAALASWARALSDARLASDLRSLAADVRVIDPSMRAALLNEAAVRIVRAAH